MRSQTGPSLAAHSKTNESLVLQWLPSHDGVDDTAGLAYSIQRLTVGLEDDWQYHDDVTWLSRQRVRINGLRAYTTYKVGFVRQDGVSLYLVHSIARISPAVSEYLCGATYCFACSETVDTRSSADADNWLDAFSSQSRSTNMVAF